LLRVDDALQQVLDFLRVADDAKASLGRVHEDFEWRLESARTNSPFTVTAIAEPTDPAVDIFEHAHRVKQTTAKAIEDCSEGSLAPAWLSVEGADALSAFFLRNMNGVAGTVIDFEGDRGSLEITKERAENALPVLGRLPINVGIEDIPPRIAYGELDGRMVAVGRYYNRPAIQLATALYGRVWCVLSDALVERHGGEQTLGDVWSGKRLIVYGRVSYIRGGQRPSRVDAEVIRERLTSPIDISSIFDPDFTAGLDPAEYVDRLHGGDLG
jgi:hypothetical protein